MKKYVSPELEILEVKATDIIRTSNDEGGNRDDEGIIASVGGYDVIADR